jgi:hypothetical protein
MAGMHGGTRQMEKSQADKRNAGSSVMIESLSGTLHSFCWISIGIGILMLPFWKLSGGDRRLRSRLLKILRQYFFLLSGCWGIFLIWTLRGLPWRDHLPMLIGFGLLALEGAGWSLCIQKACGLPQPWLWFWLNLLLPFPGLLLINFLGGPRRAADSARQVCFSCGRILPHRLQGVWLAANPWLGNGYDDLDGIYPCRTCGTLFCGECMVDLSRRIHRCPHCNGRLPHPAEEITNG